MNKEDITFKQMTMLNEVIVQLHPMSIVAEIFVSIVFTDPDRNALSEQLIEDKDEKDNAENMIYNNQQPP